METHETLIIEAGDILPEICGTNDENLFVLEELLCTRVLCRGNELVLETGDGKTRDIFRRIVEELEEYVRSGRRPTADLIRAAYDSIMEDDSENIRLLRDVSITVPGGYSRIFPRGLAQARFVSGMRSSAMSFAVGPAGTGKTFLAVACALEEVVAKKKRKLILTRPVVEAGESLGFLPGDLAQKLNPYLRPLYDAMEAILPPENIARMQENGVIEIAPLAYMRGRSLRNCVVILDEAQNTTREQMKMFLTRMGEDARVIVTGDITQIDLPAKKNSGLIHATELLREIREIGFTFFGASDVVRHPLVRKIIHAYESETQ
ncbi:MAG: PhoH family protein [Spirochaetaceae bacterium]|nr:PhoH family protein [Spirochaetaceae bacterium]